MCKNCKSTPEAVARRTELDNAAKAFQQSPTPANRERLREANDAVRSIHNDYVFEQARQHNEEMKARGVQPLYITHGDKR